MSNCFLFQRLLYLDQFTALKHNSALKRHFPIIPCSFANLSSNSPHLSILSHNEVYPQSFQSAFTHNKIGHIVSVSKHFSCFHLMHIFNSFHLFSNRKLSERGLLTKWACHSCWYFVFSSPKCTIFGSPNKTREVWLLVRITMSSFYSLSSFLPSHIHSLYPQYIIWLF